jgi:hypothetical protein
MEIIQIISTFVSLGLNYYLYHKLKMINGLVLEMKERNNRQIQNNNKILALLDYQSK